MNSLVVIFCLLAALACLIGFATIVRLDYLKTNSGASSANQAVAAAAARAGAGDTAETLSKLLDSTSKFVEAITKAGPGLASLAAAVFFTAISAYVVTSNGPSTATNVGRSTAELADSKSSLGIKP